MSLAAVVGAVTFWVSSASAKAIVCLLSSRSGLVEDGRVAIIRERERGQAYFLSTSSFRLERVGPADASYSQVQIDLQSSSASLVLQKVFDDSLADE
jgi:hypothetical protein